MSKGIQIGLLAVIAVMLGVIAFNMTNDDDPGVKSVPITDSEYSKTDQFNTPADRAKGANAKPEKYDPLKDQKKTQSESMPKTEIVFAEYEWDFGVINEGDAPSHVFKFTNIGDEPLVLEKCKGSCGCTVPTCPKEPIPPGGSGEILVKFNSKNKKNKQTKKVTVTANTETIQTILTITADVIPAPEEAS